MLNGAEIFDLVRPDLEAVEREFAAQSNSAIRPVTEIGQYLLAGGGKRLRPAMLLLAAKFCGYSGPSAVRLGAVVELIHTATLIHDDVIDGAHLRRGQPTPNSRWGNPMTVLAGDWLYMQSFHIALEERQFRILDILIGITRQMVEGELMQLTYLGNAAIGEDEAIELAFHKTACLFAGCMQLAALLGQQPEEKERLLSEYGKCLGLAFQVVDDLLDFTSSPDKLGKPVVSDLREGKVTLPLIYALARCRPEERRAVEAVARERDFTAATPEEVIALLRRYGALETTRQKAAELACKAKACLQSFPDSPTKQALLALPDLIVNRES